jgi:Holliday junction DNA helicase RuvA
MIAAVHGHLVSKSVDRLVIATSGGVSYEIAVPLGVMERLPSEGMEVELNTVTVVRDDGWSLYGFDQANERIVFQRLLAVNGVGPRLALAIVSTLGNRVTKVIRDSDIAALCTVPGVGKKTAERISLELKDRLKDLPSPDGMTARSIPAELAVQALTNLGYGSAEADRVVRAILSQEESGEVVDIIRGALQLLTKAK